MDERRAVEARGDHAIAGLRAAAQQLLAPLVVDADDAAGRVILAEQARLRLEVRLEGVMVVEVVLRQVGKRRDRERRGVRALKVERVAGDLHGHHVAARVAHAGEQMLQVGRFRRGVRRFLMYIADDGAHGADDARSLARHAGDMLYQVGGSGFAVSTRDAHQRKRARRIVVEARRRLGHGLARVGNDHFRDVSGVGQVDLALHHEHLRAMVDGVLGEGVAVGFHADDAEERVAGLDFITSIGDALNLILRVADDGAVHAFKQFGAGLTHLDTSLRRNPESIDCCSHYILKDRRDDTVPRNLICAHKAHEFA